MCLEKKCDSPSKILFTFKRITTSLPQIASDLEIQTIPNIPRLAKIQISQHELTYKYFSKIFFSKKYIYSKNIKKYIKD